MLCRVLSLLRCRIFDKLVGKIVTKTSRGSYALINLIFMGFHFDNIPSNEAAVSGSMRALLKTVCLSAGTKQS